MLKYLKYSGLNITLKLNPLQWRLNFKFKEPNENWTEDDVVIELLPITIRLWIDNGDW